MPDKKQQPVHYKGKVFKEASDDTKNVDLNPT